MTRLEGRASMCALFLALAACSQGASPPAFSVKLDGPYVRDVNPVVNMVVNVDATERSGQIVEAASKAVRSVADGMVSGRPPVAGDFVAINFTVVAPKVALENGVGEKIVHLSYDAQQLRQTVHFGADDDALLAAAGDVGWWAPSNGDVMKDYCEAHGSGAFCIRISEELD